MAHQSGATFMCTERCDPRALKWLTSEATLRELCPSTADETTPVAFDEHSAFARAQGLAGSRFDAARLWSILKVQVKAWAGRGGKVWYAHAAAHSDAQAGRRVADTGYQHWPPVVTATLAHLHYWRVRVTTPVDQLLPQVAGKSSGTDLSDTAWTKPEFTAIKQAVLASVETRARVLATGPVSNSEQREAVQLAVAETLLQRVMDSAARVLADTHKLHVEAYLMDGTLLVARPALYVILDSSILRSVEIAVATAIGLSVQLEEQPWGATLQVPSSPPLTGEDKPVRSVSGVKRKSRRGSETASDPTPYRSQAGGAASQAGEDGGEEEEDESMLAPGVSKDEYAEMKRAFEEQHFYYVPANTFVEVTNEFALKHYDLRHAKEYLDIAWAFGGHRNFRFRVSFLDLWRLDPSRKSIHRIDFKPSEDPTVFYLPLQFAYTRIKTHELLLPASVAAGGMDADEEEALVAHREGLWNLFLTLVKAACDDKEDLVEYLLNYFAHMLQRPLEQPGVAIILTGQKGVGKDTLLDFFRLHVIGNGLSHNYTETRQFFDKHDVDRKDKIMVKMEDSDSALCKQHAKDLRARITAREGTINPKGKDPITFPNYVRYFFTANQAIPVGINDDNDRERRFVIVPVSNVLKGNTQFFTRCYDEEAGLYTPLGGHAVAEKLLARDLSLWNVRLQPKNDYQEALYEVERTPEQRFLDDGWPSGAEFKSQELFARYQRFCSDNGFPKWTETAIAFGQKLAYFVMQKKIIKRQGRAKQMFYKKVGGTGEDEADDIEEGCADEASGAAGGPSSLNAGMASFSFSSVTRAV